MHHHVTRASDCVPQSAHAPVPPCAQTLLEEHVTVLNLQYQHLCDALNRLGTIADRLLGPVPSNACDPSSPIPEYPLLEKVGRTAREFTPVIEAIHEHITRLERL